MSVSVPCVAPHLHLVPQQVSAGNEPEEMAASGQGTAQAPGTPTLKALGLPQPDFHSLVLDLSTLSFVDTVCLKSLKNVRAGAARRRALGRTGSLGSTPMP